MVKTEPMLRLLLHAVPPQDPFALGRCLIMQRAQGAMYLLFTKQQQSMQQSMQQAYSRHAPKHSLETWCRSIVQSTVKSLV
jgi:hypothetical protein